MKSFNIPRLCGVYKIVNNVNMKCYIGSSVNLKNRLSSHRCSLNKNKSENEHLQNAWNKYGPDAFEFMVILICSREDRLFYEQRCIDKFNPEYNILRIAGSPSGHMHSVETRAKMSAAGRGKPKTPEHRAKIGAAHKGRKQPPRSLEHRTKLSAANKGKTLSPEHKAALLSSRVGVPLSEEHKAALSEWHTGRHHTAESRAKMSEQRMGNQYAKGFKHTEETKKKNSDAQKKRYELNPVTDEERAALSVRTKASWTEERKIQQGIFMKAWWAAKKAAELESVAQLQ